MPTQDLPQGSALAWVCFEGTGTISILDSYNISSVTDFNVGLYEVNYSITMADTDYCVHVCADDDAITDIPTQFEDLLENGRTTTSTEVVSYGIFGAAPFDVPFVSVQVFGNPASNTTRSLTSGAAVAWAHFAADGEGGISIRDSHNIDSICEESAGNFTFTYSFDPDNAFYAIAFTVDDNARGLFPVAYESSSLPRGETETFVAVFDLLTFVFTSASPCMSFVLYSFNVGTSVVRDLPVECAQVWANWDASSGTPTLNDSFNVSSLTDEGVGNTTVNFTQSFVSADYAMVACADSDQSAVIPMESEGGGGNGSSFPRAAGNVGVRTYDPVDDIDVDLFSVSMTAYGRI